MTRVAGAIAYKSPLHEMTQTTPTCLWQDSGEIGWQLVREVTAKARSLLRPAFEAHQGRNARLSIHADPRFHRDTNRIVLQVEKFSTIAPNMIVKIPVTRAGIPAIEEATYRGISINATVCLFCRSRLL